MSLTQKEIILGLSSLFIAHTLSAQDLENNQNKRITAVRVETAPVIDGVLDDVVWQRARIINDLHEVRPDEYDPPDEETIFYVMYDKDALYVGAVARYKDVSTLRSNSLGHENDVRREDRVGIILDPLNDKVSGYMFELTANGARFDGLWEGPNNFPGGNWDGIWQGEVTRTADGYVAEYRIPFKTLSFDPDNDTWGFNVWREMKYDDSKVGWVSYNRITSPAASGEMNTLKNMEIGKGLDIVPGLSMRRTRNFANNEDEKYKLEPSLDVFYKISEGLNASLTLNTDFSATEIDDRQVDLTRFNLFFPEKRDFFLKDSEIFEFGNIGGSDSLTSVNQVERENARPFFSRSVGLSDTGEPIDLDIGGKLSGQIKGFNVGLQAIQQSGFIDQNGDTIDDSQLVIGRLSRTVLDESSIGAIMTYGDPRSNLENYLYGFDFRYLNDSLPGGNSLVGHAWFQQTHTEDLNGDDMAWSLGLSLPNQNKWRGRLAYTSVQENFNPEMGFINRRGVNDYAAEIGYTWRPRNSYIRHWYSSLDARHVARISDGGLQSQRITGRLGTISNHSGDSMSLLLIAFKEGLDRQFEISPGVVLPVGLYPYNRYGIRASGSTSRKIVPSFAFFNGEYFSGDRVFYDVALAWRPSKHIGLTGSLTYNDIELPEGDFITRLMTFKSEIYFSNELSWINLVQFDNVSDNLGINSRIHWNPENGQDVFFVVNWNMLDTEDRGFVSQRADFTFKVNYTFRF